MRCENFELCFNRTRASHSKCQYCIVSFTSKILVKSIHEVYPSTNTAVQAQRLNDESEESKDSEEAEVDVCPLCLLEPKGSNARVVMPWRCGHWVCVKCFRGVFFPKFHYKKKPNVPRSIINRWNVWMDSGGGGCMRARSRSVHDVNLFVRECLDTLVSTRIRFDYYDQMFASDYVMHNLNTIPKIFRSKIDTLVRFETNRAVFAQRKTIEASNRVASMELCCLCRADSIS